MLEKIFGKKPRFLVKSNEQDLQFYECLSDALLSFAGFRISLAKKRVLFKCLKEIDWRCPRGNIVQLLYRLF